MERRTFIKTAALFPLAASCMQVTEFNKLAGNLQNTERFPVLFVGHGSPMNAIEENQFSLKWRALGAQLPRPKAILCISAHWETRGSLVTVMPHPKTIHDFGGFPPELFAAEYPAPGSPWLAGETRSAATSTPIAEDSAWGLDHGCWSVLKQMYPSADIPVVQLSLDYTQPASYHYNLARELSVLRSKGILILGSGNMVHNLGLVAWEKFNEPGFAFDWAQEADAFIKQCIDQRNHQALIDYKQSGRSMQLAVPTPEHFLPMLYTLALQQKEEGVEYFNDVAVAGSLTMTSLLIA